MMLTLLDRHIGRSIAIGTLLALGVLLALFVFFSFIDALRDYGSGGFDLPELVRYVVLSQPLKIYQIFPTAALIGSMLGLSALALNSELVAMRAAGVSVSRIVASALKVGLVFAILAVALGEYVVPGAENAAQLGRAKAMHKGVYRRSSGLWLRDGATYVNIGEVLPDFSLLRVSIYHFDDDNRLRAQTSAGRARFADGAWRLEEVRQSRIGDNAVQVRQAPTESWATHLTRETVAVFALSPDGLSMQNLYRYIRHLQQNNQDTRGYRIAFWQKLLSPLATIVMVLLATPFVFQPVRSGGLSQRIFLGVMLGLAFIMVNNSFGYFGVLYGLPPVLGALLPIVLFLALAFYLLRRAG